MKALEYRTIDKSTWGNGPWQDECDKRQWLDAASGLPCMIRRNPSLGFWCGYVGVPPTHPAFGKGYDDVAANAHGGLTFSDTCSDGDESEAICHVVEPGESDRVWWLGFDCGHAFDLSPAYHARHPKFHPMPRDVYRDQAYVTAETLELARQLAAMRDNNS